MEIRLDLGFPHTPLSVVVEGRLDVQNAAAFQQLVRSLQHAAGSGLTCDLSGTDVADAAGRSAVESVRHLTEEFGGVVLGAGPHPVAALAAQPAADGHRSGVD